MGRLALSHSSIQTFEACPLRFKAEKVDKIKAQPSIPMALGSLVHEVTDVYFKHLVKTGQQSDFAWIEAEAQRAWKARAGEYLALPEILYEDYMGLVYAIREGCSINPRDVVASEQDLAFNERWEKVPWMSKEAFFRAKIDRLELRPDLTARVWDLKTGRKIEKDANTPQTRIYAFLVTLILPEAQKIVADLYFPRKQATYSFEFEVAGLGAVKDWIMRTSDRVEEARAKGDWPARIGPGCRDCPIFGDCPARKATRAALVRPPQDSGEAEALVERLVVMEREREEIREVLKHYVDTNGAVEAAGMLVDYVVSHKLSWPTEELYVMLQEAGLNPLRFLKGDSKLLAREVRKNEALKAKIDAITKDKPSTTFKLLVAGDDDEGEE